MNKKRTSWNKGIKMSEEYRAKLSMVRKGHTVSEETRKKISDDKKRKGIRPSFLGKSHSETTKQKIREINVGKKHSEETRQKMRLAKKGVIPKNVLRVMADKQKHWNWRGGLRENPYPAEFNRDLKLKIRFRDGFKCCICFRTEREELEEFDRVLCVNHIDFDKNNCREENLNTLCLRCNVKINRDRDYWTNYFQTNG